MTRTFTTALAALALAAPSLLAGPIIAPVITLDLPTLPPGKTLTIEYDTTVGSLNGNTSDLSTFATVTADGGIIVLSSDPATGSGPTLTGVFENTAPTIVGGETLPVGAPEDGLTSYTFKIVYADDTVDASTIDANDVTVTGPGGPIPVTSGTTTDPNGATVTGNYTFTPPGGSWDVGDNGTYTIGMVGMQVSDTGSPALFVAAQSTVSSFTVNIPTPSYTITANDADKAEGNSGTTDFTFTVNRSGDTSVAGSVAYTVSGADAADFASSLTGTLPFPANTASVPLTVQIVGDDGVETDEAFTVTLSNPMPSPATVIGSPSSANGTIQNDDSSVSVAVSPGSTPEDGAGNLVYTFTRSGAITMQQTVNFNVGGDAELGTDFTQSGATTFSASSGTVVIEEGEATVTVTIDPTADTDFEADETVTLTVVAGSGYGVGAPDAATGTIANDDTLTINIAADDADADENTSDPGNFRISRNATSGALNVQIQLSAASTATPAQDFSLGGVMLTGGAGTVTIPDGQSFIDIPLTPNDDAPAEASETATLEVVADPGYTVGTAEDTITIAANDFVVTNTSDFDPVADANGGEGTLRQAILNANAIPAPQTITFSDVDGTAFTTAPQAIVLTSGQLQLTSEATISGPILPGRVTIDGDGASRVINVQGSGGPAAPEYVLSRMTIAGGQAAGVGAGILVEFSNITLEDCVVEANSGTSGGGMFVDEGVVRIIRSIFRNNTALGQTGQGGGIYISNSTLSPVRVRGSTISNNESVGGGGIWLTGSTPFSAVNCTISGNLARSEGGGISVQGTSTASLDHVTLTGNHADTDQGGGGPNVGGGTFTAPGASLTINNSIIAGNVVDGAVPTASDLHGPVVAGSGHNLIGVDTGLTGITDSTGGNQIGSSGSPIDPLLGSLADNGGTTPTHELLVGSPAINTGDPSFNPAAFIPPLAFDQRGPGFDRIASGQLDIGAFETQADITPPVITCPADVTIECDESTDPSNTGTATAIDAIDPSPVITFADVVTTGVGGNSSIARTWTATDAEGNMATCVQTITVVDTTPPVITCPADVIVACDDPIDPANTGIATAIDNCDPTPAITFADVSAPGTGDDTVITRTWTATDANGNASTCDQIITIQVFRPTLVGTAPNDGIPDQDAIEDDAPIAILLESFFADVDQDVATLIYTVEANDTTTLVSTDITGTTLTLTLGADQSGTANLTVRATDKCGLSVDSPFILTVTKQIDLAVTAAESAATVAAGSNLPGNLIHTVTVTNNGPSDATGVSLDVTGAVPAGVSVDSATADVGGVAGTVWNNIDLAVGATATLTRTISVAATASGGIDVIPTNASVTGANEPIANTGDDSAAVATSIISPADVGTFEIDVTPVLNLQSGLFDQRVRVTNNNPLPIAGLRLSVQNLPANVTLYNAHGSTGGVPYVDYNESLAPGASVELALEFFRPNLDGNFDPVYVVSEVRTEDPVDPPTAATGSAIDRTERLGNGDFLIEFTATPGSEYAIEYSANGTDWKRAVPTITAPANKVQWIDNGPPKTESHPSTATIRLYRVVLVTP